RYYNADTPALAADDQLRLRLPIKAGTREIFATFPVRSSALGQDMIKARNYGPDFGLKGLPEIEGITITGPFGAVRPVDSPGRRIITCHPSTAAEELPCAKKIIAAFARRAYRGVATDADVKGLVEFYEQGRKTGSFDDGIEMAVWRVLSDPQ